MESEAAESRGANMIRKRSLVILLILMAALSALVMCSCVVSNIPDSIPAFTSYDLNGNEADESVFANADITVVNIWGTFCGPCKDEMPDLAEWEKELPDNVQIIGIVCDVPNMEAAEYKAAQEIVAENGIRYTNIIAAGKMADYMNNVAAVPTTLFVDSEGHFLHRPFVGADVGGYKSIVNSLLK